MSGKRRRLDRLYPALSAKERAILVLRALKADSEEDPEVRRTMPNSQVDSFNRYMSLIRGVNVGFGFFITRLASLMEYLDAHYGWIVRGSTSSQV